MRFKLIKGFVITVINYFLIIRITPSETCTPNSNISIELNIIYRLLNLLIY